MIYSPTDFTRPLIESLHPAAHLDTLEDDLFDCGAISHARVLGPAVAEPEELYSEILDALPRDLDPDSAKARLNYFNQAKTVGKQPCSLDILLGKFSDVRGHPYEFPFVVPPGESFVGYGKLHFRNGVSHGRYIDFTPENILCAETRSGFARKGLVCLGFQTEDKKLQVFYDASGPLNFVFRNVSENALEISQPFAPVQITANRQRQQSWGDLAFRLERDGRDVTNDNRVSFGAFTAYKVHLAEDLVYTRRTQTPVNIHGKEIESLAVRTTVDQIHSLQPDFCLTLTEEMIHTNGCPVYMFPFHYLDAEAHQHGFYNTESMGYWFQMVFDDPAFLPVTGNAGLINPGPSIRVVCENVTKGRDLKKYFRPHEPFALVIPVPFASGKLDCDSYQGKHKQQDTITF